jgi:hypothetical protein
MNWPETCTVPVVILLISVLGYQATVLSLILSKSLLRKEFLEADKNILLGADTVPAPIFRS